MFIECSSDLQVNIYRYVYDKCIVLRAASVTHCTHTHKHKSVKNEFTDQRFHKSYITEHNINHI